MRGKLLWGFSRPSLGFWGFHLLLIQQILLFSWFRFWGGALLFRFVYKKFSLSVSPLLLLFSQKSSSFNANPRRNWNWYSFIWIREIDSIRLVYSSYLFFEIFMFLLPLLILISCFCDRTLILILLFFLFGVFRFNRLFLAFSISNLLHVNVQFILSHCWFEFALFWIGFGFDLFEGKKNWIFDCFFRLSKIVCNWDHRREVGWVFQIPRNHRIRSYLRRIPAATRPRIGRRSG